MVNTQSYQRRFDVALESLTRPFTDLVVLVEALDQRLEKLERLVEAQAVEIKYLHEQLRAARPSGGGETP